MTTMRPTGVHDVLAAAEAVAARHADIDAEHRAAIERAAVEVPEHVESAVTESTAH